MLLEAVISDVTRMQIPNVCIAALHKGRTIRLDSPQPKEQWVKSIGGLVPGDVVSLDWKPSPKPVLPHTEDGEWNPATFTKHHRLAEMELITLLSANALRSVQDAFGTPCVRGSGGNAAFQPRTGIRSVASVMAQSVRAYPDDDGIRVDFADDEDSWTTVPLQDLIVRQHQKQCPACSSQFSRFIANEFQGDMAVLRVGLAREFAIGGHPSLCWMQVNHIFLIPPKRKHFLQ